MGIHNKINPHHHVTIWIAAAGLLLSSAVFSSAASVNQTLAENNQPSQNTQKFFGFQNGGKEQPFVQPVACQQSTNQVQQLSQQLQAYSIQLQNILNQQHPTLAPGQIPASGSAQPLTADQNAQIQDLQQKITATQAQMTALTKNLQAGPGDDCKKAMVLLSIDRLQALQDKMNKENAFFGTLAKVDQAVAKIQTVLPSLQASGFDQAKITKINTDIATVKAQEVILTSFFNKMKTFMQNFIAQAKADPLKAFDSMRSGSQMSPTEAGSAATAADSMVTAFQDLVSLLDDVAK